MLGLWLLISPPGSPNRFTLLVSRQPVHPVRLRRSDRQVRHRPHFDEDSIVRRVARGYLDSATKEPRRMSRGAALGRRSAPTRWYLKSTFPLRLKCYVSNPAQPLRPGVPWSARKKK